MASSLFRHLATCLTRQVTWLTLTSSPAASAFRCLHRLSAAPHTLLTSTRVGALQSASAESSAQCGPSLLGQCQHICGVQPSAGMKTKSALKRRCKDCFFVRRRGHLFVFCKTNPRHKQRQG